MEPNQVLCQEMYFDERSIIWRLLSSLVHAVFWRGGSGAGGTALGGFPPKEGGSGGSAAAALAAEPLLCQAATRASVLRYATHPRNSEKP